MAAGGAGGAAAAAAIAAMIQATKAMGVIVKMEPDQWRRLLDRVGTETLIVRGTRRVFRTYYQYLFSYRGLAFYTETKEEMNLPGSIESVNAKNIWLPG